MGIEGSLFKCSIIVSELVGLMERDSVVGLSDRHEIGPSYYWVGLIIIYYYYYYLQLRIDEKKRIEWNVGAVE